jgi:hypothetical protein
MTSLPLWLQIVGLIAGLLGSLWPLYQLKLAVFGPKLEVRLTKDLFFRFIDIGECIFLRPVLIAEHGNVLIKGVQAKLIRTVTGGSKDWELEFLKFGEVMTDNKSVEPNFCFQSSSPFRFLSKGFPVQAVYLARVKNYGAAYETLVNEFKEKLNPLKIQSTQSRSYAENKSQTDELNRQIKTLSDEYGEKIFDKIQLEEGKYEVELKVKYSGISGISAYFTRSTKITKLSFEIEKNAREQIKSTLQMAVYMSAMNIVSSSNLIVNYPEYSPINKQEDNVL